MRACFLGPNICGLGFGVATLHTPPLVMDQPVPEALESLGQHVSAPPGSPGNGPEMPDFVHTQAVANSPRLTA